MKILMINLFMSVVAFLVCGIPTWTYLGARALMSPNGFWQEFVLLGFGTIVLGGVQIFLFFGFIACLVVIWKD